MNWSSGTATGLRIFASAPAPGMVTESAMSPPRIGVLRRTLSIRRGVPPSSAESGDEERQRAAACEKPWNPAAAIVAGRGPPATAHGLGHFEAPYGRYQGAVRSGRDRPAGRQLEARGHLLEYSHHRLGRG